MLFGMKNVEVTYQNLIDKILQLMIGRHVQTYVDDMVVTSSTTENHWSDLEELFIIISILINVFLV